MTNGTSGIIAEYQPNYPEFTDLFISNGTWDSPDFQLSQMLIVVYPYIVDPQSLFDLLIDKFGALPEGELSAVQTR
jgi:hypothetical protein